ncbi:MAG: hypothetical protein CMK65_09165 [Pseudoalteromonas sp.]|nr:hypothetical protein [Pseudoalteromonas sp.]|tara:strand:- start:486 stop:671 length:186 start_codon:yes stop_codon:yes gene_type:complete
MWMKNGFTSKTLLFEIKPLKTFISLQKRYKGVTRNLLLVVQVTLSFSYYTISKFLEHIGKK